MKRKRLRHPFRALDYLGFIYIAQDSDSTILKIGFTINPRQRLSWLNTCESRSACPGKRIRFIGLMPGTQRIEHALHIKFDHERLCSKSRSMREWFREGGDVRAWVDGLSLKSLDEIQPRKKPGPKPEAKIPQNTS